MPNEDVDFTESVGIVCAMMTGQAISNLQFILSTLRGLPEVGRKTLTRQMREELAKFLNHLEGATK